MIPSIVEWAKGIDRLAELPNVVMKLGGIASIVTGYDAHTRDRPPSSRDFVDERGAYFHYAIRRFGAERCFFETNFPVDSVAISYADPLECLQDHRDGLRRGRPRCAARRHGASHLPDVAAGAGSLSRGDTHRQCRRWRVVEGSATGLANRRPRGRNDHRTALCITPSPGLNPAFVSSRVPCSAPFAGTS